MRAFHRERERGAQLIAVERAMAGGAHPARALPRPILAAEIFARQGSAGLVAGEAGAAGAVIFAAGKPLEAETLVGEPHRPVGISFTGGNRVAHSGDEHVAHAD